MQKYMLKTKNTYMYVKHSRKKLQGLKKFHVEALNLTFKIHITLNSYSIFEK